MKNDTSATNLQSSRPASQQTPLMQQYWDIKSAHEDKILLFRMGDFFEMFCGDAEIAAPVLGIALTSRNKKAPEETRMCGVPHHSIANSINKLLANGFKVAICDQIEDPKFAKGLVKRAVTRILSPGVVFDPDTLDALRANYIASADERSVSFLDTTTGEAFYFLVRDRARQNRMLRNLQPVEVIVSEQTKDQVARDDFFHPLITVHDKLGPDLGPDVGGLAWPESARRLLAYATHMQGEKILETILPFESRELMDRMELPQTAVRHLELFDTYKGEAKGSLFHAVNRCKTSSGARLFRAWLQFPLVNPEAIERRLDRVDGWLKKPESLRELRSVLGGLGDVQRRMAKLGNPSVNARDLQALSESLKAGLEVCRIASGDSWEDSLCSSASMIAREIDDTIADEPPIQLKNGGLVRRGVDEQLDELIELSTNSHQLILNLETKEREETGISSLKIRFNNVFGYYIEITNTHKDKVPKGRYERKQTLANAERYLTPELAELETKVLSAQAKRIELEISIFNGLIARCLAEGKRLLKLASLWAEVDVVSALAQLAIEENYCRPQLRAGGDLYLKASRHPVIEQTLSMPFVANDISLARGGCLMLTGPNMAGKSTLMRQVACAVLLAQCGSFVPAQCAELPIFDRVLTRIGASDFLSEGLSTFMVEMKETAEMLETATEDSLVILDEVGRGTSTYDGMSLAQAILEFLLESRLSMTFFATHYHELTELAGSYPQLHNSHMSIFEKKSADGKAEITFLHQLARGPANKSYGIHVGKLAGLPASVTKRAAMILRRLEGEHRADTRQMTLMSLIDRATEEAASPEESFAPLSPEFEALKEEVKAMDLSRLTPLEALNQIAKWQQSLS